MGWYKTSMGVVVADTKIISQGMSQEKQAGYQCEACNVVNIVYGDAADAPPGNCINCGGSAFKKQWSHLLKTIETTESIP